jgi:ABC-type transport system involved in resistance to organic solvents, auxiliary component
MIFTRRRLFATIAAATLLAAPARALDPAEAETFVRDTVDGIIDIIRDADAADARVDEMRALIERTTAVEAIARFTMGATWRQMSDAQRDDFLAAFRNYAARSYVNRVGEYSGQTVEVTGAQDVGRKGILVTSVLKSPNADDIQLEWLVSDRTGETQIVDLIAEGVSLSISQRQEFGAMLERRGGDVDRFIADLDTLG